MLLTMLPAELFANHWLTVKLAFVAIYFIAGWTALSPGLARRSRRLVLLAVALGAFCIAYEIARAHDPMGWIVGE
ncbi:MAG: SirB2 family protein, partial [Sphingomicrobium sp.]